MFPSRKAHFVRVGAAVLLAGMALGCGSHVSPPLSTGRVAGGQQPVTGSLVYMLSPGLNGLHSLSSSLLVPGRPGVSTDSAGRGFVTTDATGSFLLTGRYDACPDPATPVYLVALGGNPGLPAGSSNAALALAVSVGSCGNLSPTQLFTINELTTVAFASGFAPFAADAFHVGAAANLTGALQDAQAAASALVNLATGTANTSYGRAVIPATAINTLGNVLAPCVNSAGPGSSACTALTSLTGGAADTLSAAIAIASTPAANVPALFNQATAAAPFQPTLTQPPADWTLAPQIAAAVSTASGLTALGDSISTVADGNGASPATLGYIQLLANYLGGSFLNRSQGGDESVDASSKAFYYGLPANTANAPATFMIGTNDIYFEDPNATNNAHQQAYRETALATLSLGLTPPSNKLTPYGNAACSGAGWSYDGSFPGAVNGPGVFTSTVGVPFTCTYTTYGGPIYFWHLVDSSQGTGTVVVDGLPCASFSNTFSSYAGSHNGIYNTIAAVRCPAAAGTHTIAVQLTGGSHIGFEGLGTPPAAPLGTAPPRMFTFGPLHQAADSSAIATSLYSKLLENLTAQMAADGFLVQYVNVRDHVIFAGTLDPTSSGTAGASCMANQLHPANCGHASMFSTLQTTISKAN